MKIFIVIPVLTVSLSLYATIINIPADFSTIQEGINSSIDSDTVLVQPGIYYENIDFSGHRITLGSLFLTTADSSYIPLTIIDGGSSGTVVSFLSGEDSAAVITGFTIQNGFNWDGGGGILCESSDPVITNNIIKDNLADSGGGIKCISSNTRILYNIIHIVTTAQSVWRSLPVIRAEDHTRFHSGRIRDGYPVGSAGFRTRKLSPPAPMVLVGQPSGRVGHCRL